MASSLAGEADKEGLGSSSVWRGVNLHSLAEKRCNEASHVVVTEFGLQKLARSGSRAKSSGAGLGRQVTERMLHKNGPAWGNSGSLPRRQLITGIR